MSAEIGFDYVYWQDEGGNILSPRPGGGSPIEINTPILNVENIYNGTARITVSNTLEDQTNIIYYAIEDEDPEYIALKTFDGDLDAASFKFDTGYYYFYVYSSKLYSVKISKMIRVYISNTLDSQALTEEEQYVRSEGEYILVRKNEEIVSETGARKNRYVDYANVWAWHQDLSGTDLIRYEKRDIYVTGKVFITEELDISEGDILVFKETTYKCQSKIDQAGLNNLYRIDVEEII